MINGPRAGQNSALRRSSSRETTTAAVTVLVLIAFAANSLFCRLALAERIIDPASYTAVRLITGAAALRIIVVLRPKGSFGKSGGSWISAAILFLYAVTFSFAYISLSAGTGALILFAAVQITMIAAGLYTGERPGILEWVGLLIAIAGLIYLVSPGVTAPSSAGSVLMATAGVAWGVYSLRGRAAGNPVRVTTDNFLGTVPLAMAVVLLRLPLLTITPRGILWAALSGSITSGLGYVMWYAVLPRLTATRAATLQLAVPVLAAIGGVIVLCEAVSLRLVISSVVILGGVGLAVSYHKPRRERQERSPAAAPTCVSD